MQINPKWTRISQALLALEDCTNYGARFVSRTGEATYYTYQEIIARAKSAAGTLQARGLAKGDRVAVILPTSLQFFDALLGVQLAGGIPAALYPPFRLGKLDEYFSRTSRMLAQVGTRFLITDSRIRKLLGPAVEGVECLKAVLDADSLLGSERWSAVDTSPETPAFLQFSSGTTVHPKAVMVSHTNLLWNLEMMDSVFRTFSNEESAEERGGVCWVPLYHDMGLVGCLFMGLYHPGTVTYIGPENFIVRPALWLQTLSRYKGLLSPAPHFAYSLCLSKIKDDDMDGVDLSNWKVALNGAEPIEPDSMRRFSERFAKWGFRPEAMTPVYGLAEAGLAVSFSDPRALPLTTEFERTALAEAGAAVPGQGRRIVSVGKPLPGIELQIWDESSAPLREGEVGRIMIKGPSITRGYFNDSAMTEQVIRNGWLDTGDLGFLHDGNLYISGRLKDLIIVRGRNYAPQEIEDLLDLEGVRTGCVVAVAQQIGDEGEQLIILAEKDIRSPVSDEEVAKAIRNKVVSTLALTPYHVQMLKPGTLPRTSSGKLRRRDALNMFLAGELLPPEKMGALRLLQEVGKSQISWGRFWLRNRGNP